MKASVDPDVCTGCGLCVDTCPAVFEMDDAVAKVLVANVPEDVLDTCREAADNCPVEAISIKE
ncbi:MAG: ferredoxin [Kiritimatiellaeota bacterium]|nr:ferredoxin [Kiritimatiellota bacterium]